MILLAPALMLMLHAAPPEHNTAIGGSATCNETALPRAVFLGSPDRAGPCVPDELRQRLSLAIAQRERGKGVQETPRTPPLYPFFPQGGTPYRALTLAGF